MRIEAHIKEIDKVFFDYDVERIKKELGYNFESALFRLKFGNRRITDHNIDHLPFFYGSRIYFSEDVK